MSKENNRRNRRDIISGRFIRQNINDRSEWKEDIEPSDFTKKLWATSSLTGAEIKFLNAVDKFRPGKTEEAWNEYRQLTAGEKKSQKLKRFILWFGEEEGTKRYNETKKKGLTKERFISLYGEEEGTKRFEELRDRRRDPLKLFVKKYGDKEGLERYKQWCNNNAGNHTLKRKIELYGEEEGTRRYNEFIEKCRERGKQMVRDGLCLRSSNSYSNIANSFFDIILQELANIDYNIDNIITKVKDELEHKVDLYFLDFCDVEKKLYIEFYGDRWHGNPILYKPDDHPYPRDLQITAKELWERDKKRNDFIESQGYKKLIIWEYEYKHNKDATINKALNFILNE